MYAPNTQMNPFDQLDLDIRSQVFHCDNCGWSGLDSTLDLIKIDGVSYSCCPHCADLDVRPFNDKG